MKRLTIILALLLCASPVMACDVLNAFNGECSSSQPMQLAWMNAAVIGGGGGAVACDPDTSYIGDQTDYYPNVTTNGVDSFFCQYRTSNCAGNLEYGHIADISNVNTKYVKICVYTGAGTTPSINNTLIGCTNAIQGSGTHAWITSSSKAGGAVEDATSYLICVVSLGAWDQVRRNDAPAGHFVHLATLVGGYATPPANLAGAWSSYDTRDLSVWIGIE